MDKKAEWLTKIKVVSRVIFRKLLSRELNFKTKNNIGKIISFPKVFGLYTFRIYIYKHQDTFTGQVFYPMHTLNVHSHVRFYVSTYVYTSFVTFHSQSLGYRHSSLVCFV